MRKALPLLSVLLLLVLGYLWLGRESPSDPNDAGVQANPEHQELAAAELDRDPAKGSEPSMDRADLSAEVSEEVRPPLAADSSRIRLEITTRAGIPGHPPADAAHWTARLCIYPDGWESFRWLEVPFDENGIAVLDYPLHRALRRAVAVPPATSTYGAGYLIRQQLEDPQVDETYLINLHSARHLSGKVATPEGQFLAGVPVQAFLDEEAPYLGYWQDSSFTTLTDATGSFHFPQLGPGIWTFAVTPIDWLMIDPLHGRQKNGNGIANLEAGKDTVYDLGTLTVIASKEIRISVLDNAGTPIPAAGLQVFPLELERDDLQSTGWQNAGVRKGMHGLPFEYRYRSTLKNGAADFCLPVGRYRLEVRNIPGVVADGTSMVEYEFHTDNGDFTFQIYAQISRLHGLLLDADGKPMPESGIDLSWETLDGTNTSGLFTDEQGRFDFPAVARGKELQLHLKPYYEEGLPASWTVSATQEVEEITLRAPPTYPLHLRFQTAEGNPPTHPNLTLELVAWNPGPGADPEALKDWWRRAKAGIMHSPEEDGRVTIPHLAAGSYEVKLESRGQEIGRWTLATGEDVHQLQVAAPR